MLLQLAFATRRRRSALLHIVKLLLAMREAQAEQTITDSKDIGVRTIWACVASYRPDRAPVRFGSCASAAE